MSDNETTIRRRDEIQHAHDVLGQLIVDGELLQKTTTPSARLILEATLDALCWVLCHEATSFETVIRRVVRILRENGIAIACHPGHRHGLNGEPHQ